MGIRIHKSLGYGLDLSKIPNIDILDTEEKIHEFYEMEPKDLYNILLCNVKKMPIAERELETLFIKWSKKKTIVPYEHVIYDFEFGNENIVQFIPISQTANNQWKRYDDAIDYYDYIQRYGCDDLETKIEWIDNPLYPFTGLMRKNPELPFGIEKYHLPLYHDIDPTGNHIPIVPFHIMETIKILDIVPNEQLIDTFLSLRPCIYTYWG